MLNEADQTELAFAATQKHRIVETIEHGAKEVGQELQHDRQRKSPACADA
jgi:hypothetical protein